MGSGRNKFTLKDILLFVIIIDFLLAGFYLSNTQADIFIKALNFLELMVIPSKLGMSFGATGSVLTIVGVLLVVIYDKLS